ncbi:hypothetical protein SAMN02745121_06838 [Nannocystis exedens]|uniref:Uncharacterized protein n=1 Tax=Nannocystis exedens TaxID=54 RepID=A0A1I2FVT2_9BACT|nr:hypothetical protein [Nannocystis exedens]PCC73720.1 hypothetical protein NAEX_06808 [Nannocystis exedens]SFF08616.1 hypothetical protein SAMN02745121_06838 [Nannocystis exedens]
MPTATGAGWVDPGPARTSIDARSSTAEFSARPPRHRSRATTVPGKKGQKPRQKRAWVQGEAKYGLEHGPPGPSARANPVYVRELQEDLIWLGYLSTSRGSVTPGEFDVFTLGAVLGFKQDLIEIYGIATSHKRIDVKPGSVRAGEFSTAIWSQPKFLSPVRIMLDWVTALRGGGKRKGVFGVAKALVSNVQNNLAKAKTAKKFRAYLERFEHHRATLEALMDSWPHLAALEAVDRLFKPFAPKAATKAVGELAPVPPGKQPKHDDSGALAADAVWSSEGYNARDMNRSFFLADLNKALEAVKKTLAHLDDLRGRMAALRPAAEVDAEWTPAKSAAEQTVTTLTTLLGLVRYWILDSPTQVTAWLAHIVEMGTVDQPTAVYLKALREGGKIGPGRRPAYPLQPLTSKDDFASPDALATFLREECTKRTPNAPGAKSTTMPEIVALQFFGNETGLKFTHSLAPFNTRAEDKDTRLVMLGVDTNSYRKGSFDAVFHAGGDWFWSRGWGVGQATEANGTLDGMQLRRGLPILPPGSDAVQHPKAYVDSKTSITDAMTRKVLAKYNRTMRRDCTFGGVPFGAYYDCHSCLKRFFDENLRGVGKYGEGGAFVPKNETVLGNPDHSDGFFLDLERYTPFSRGKDGVEDPDAAKRYRRLFNADPGPVDPNVAQVLRKMDGATAIATAAEVVAKAAGVDKATLVAAVQAHVKARTQLPCSWLQVRISYAGKGEQAFSSRFDLLDVVGDLKASNDTVIKHIKEASELRRS